MSALASSTMSNGGPPQTLAIRPGAMPPSPPNSIPSTTHSSMNNSTNRIPGPYAGPPPPHPANGEHIPIPRKYSSPPSQMDEQLYMHFRVLRSFLADSAQDDPSMQVHSRARDKLLRLSPTQFQELSTDVYDELLRRQDERRHPPPAGNVPAFLLPRSNFHTKRNQARQKLSTLAIKKFRELATDVLYELERRHSEFVTGAGMGRMRSGSNRSNSNAPPGRRRGSSVSRQYNGGPPPQQGGNGAQLPAHVQSLRRPSITSPNTPYSPTFTNTSGVSSGNEYGKPLPKNFQSNTMVPNKSAVVEDDGDQSRYDGSEYNFEGGGRVSSRRTTAQSSPYGDHFPPADYQNQVAQLELRVLELENQVRQKDSDISKHQTAHKEVQQTLEAEQTKSVNLKSDLEKQLESANSLNTSLQAELETIRAANAALQESVRNEPAGPASEEWRNRYESLERSYSTQQQLTDRVRAEAAQALQEMRLLASRSNDAADREETLHQQITDLQSAVEASKSRYAKTKAQLQHMRAISTGILYASQPSAGHYAKDAALKDPAGLVTDVAVTKYQIAVDDLLRISREDSPRAVHDYMRTIVASVRGVTSEIDTSLASTSSTARSLPDAERRRIQKLKLRVSSAASNLITAARNYSTGNGLSPVSLVDVAVSNLTATIVELVKLAKVRPSGVSNDMDAEFNAAEDSGVEEGGMDGRDVGLGMSMSMHSSIGVGMGMDGEISPLASSTTSRNHHINQSIASTSQQSNRCGSGHSLGNQHADQRYVLGQSQNQNQSQSRQDVASPGDEASGVGMLLSSKAYSPDEQLPRSQFGSVVQGPYQHQQAQQGEALGHMGGIGMAYGHSQGHHAPQGVSGSGMGLGQGMGGFGMANGGTLGFDPGHSPGPEFGPNYEAFGSPGTDGSPFA